LRGDVHRDFCAFVHPKVFSKAQARRLCGPAGLQWLRYAAAENERIAVAEICSPVGRVPHGIRRVSVVRLIADVDPLEAIPAPAGAVVTSCCGKR
jgi:hypothetical protein